MNKNKKVKTIKVKTKELALLRKKYKKGLLKFNSKELAKAMLKDKYTRHGLIKL